MHRIVAAMLLVATSSLADVARAAPEDCGETEISSDARCSVFTGTACDDECAGEAEACADACAAEGALFCDDAFIDAPDLEACAEYLESIGVDLSATASAECEGEDCEAEAKEDDEGDDAPAADDGGCTASGAGSSRGSGGVAVALLVSLVAVARRRRG